MFCCFMKKMAVVGKSGFGDGSDSNYQGNGVGKDHVKWIIKSFCNFGSQVVMER